MADFSPKLFTIFGIDIEMHWTFLLLLLIALIAGLDTFAIIVMLFFFVVLHELSHSVVSLKYGVPVKKILLFPLGGASIIDLDEVKPDVGLKIALAGPLMSVLLAVLFGIGWVYTTGAISQLFEFSALINILLGIFNFLPAFPLDGGRMLKSYLEEKRGDLEATKLAVKISNIVMVFFIIGILIYSIYFTGGSIADIELGVIWDLIIVFFIYAAAQSELQSAYIKKYTSGMKVNKLVSSNYIMVKPTTSMLALYKLLLSSKTHIVVFKKDSQYMLVSRIVANPLGKDSKELLEKRVQDFAQLLPQLDYGGSLSKAIEKMRYEDTSALAVVKKGKLVGLLLADHIDAVLALHMPQIMKEH